MIRELVQNEMLNDFFELMAEVECGNHFDFNNANHIQWLEEKISRHYYRGTKFWGYYNGDNTPIGFASLLIEEGPEGIECFGHVAELMDIAIFDEFRGDGYGSELLKYIEDYCINRGKHCLYMSTYAKDYKVISFYGKNGFIPVATLPDMHGPNDEGQVFMRKLLNPIFE